MSVAPQRLTQSGTRLKSVSLISLRKILQCIIKKAVRNKVLDEGTIDGYTVAAIDGTKLIR